ncbi:DMT family transporter [Alcaligenes faecalis]|nr:DMT family transporter [Alcaligenes faecalis]
MPDTQKIEQAAKHQAAHQTDQVSYVALFLLTSLTMLAFAANSLLTRMAFQTTLIDAASFTAIRISTGAITLFLISLLQAQKLRFSALGGVSAILLFIYALAFSFAYRSISTGTGALILFAAAQLLMISYGLFRGERTSVLGLLMALGGLVFFLAPGASAPPWGAALLMAISGLAWGGFSLLGKASESPVAGTASSFLLAVPLSLLTLWLHQGELQVDPLGVLYAALSGSLASGIGYAIWYWVRLRMSAITAASVQLSVPVLTAVLGLLILDEQISLKSALAALLVLGGIAVVILTSRRKPQE